MNIPQRLDKMREKYDENFINLCSIVIPKEGKHQDVDKKEEVWKFFESHFSTLLNEIGDEILP